MKDGGEKERDSGVAHRMRLAIQAITRKSSVKKLLEHLPELSPREGRALGEGLSVLNTSKGHLSATWRSKCTELPDC